MTVDTTDGAATISQPSELSMTSGIFALSNVASSKQSYTATITITTGDSVNSQTLSVSGVSVSTYCDASSTTITAPTTNDLMKARRTPFYLYDTLVFSMTNPTCYYDTDSMDLGSADFSYVGSSSSNDWTAIVTMDQPTNLVNGDHQYSVTVSAEGGASATAYGSMLIATPTGSTLEDLTGYPDCVGPTCTFYSDSSDYADLGESITVEMSGIDSAFPKMEP